MPTSFKMIAHQNSDNLHLRLIGDFDSAAAVQLVHKLQREVFRCHRIYIHTCCLSSFDPFAARLFLKKCAAADIAIGSLVFTGDYKDQLAPCQDTDMTDVFPDIPATPWPVNVDEYAINLSAIPKNNLYAYSQINTL